jgi:hypothetical protein
MTTSGHHAPGDPLQIIPVLQSHTSGARTLTLIALERWHSALFATIELVGRTPGSEMRRIVTAEFTADLRDARGTVYQLRYSGGGAGGGPDIMTSHDRIGFTPVPPSHVLLVISVSTHFTEQFHPSMPDEQGWTGHGNDQPVSHGTDRWMSMTLLLALDPADTTLHRHRIA